MHVHEEVDASEGDAEGDAVCARPGYSEHQAGLAVDLVTPDHPDWDFRQCFATTPASGWIALNVWRYGFIVRYTAGDEAITGCSPEPWYLRYVGRPLAAQMHRIGVTTLEQDFDIQAATTLRGVNELDAR